MRNVRERFAAPPDPPPTRRMFHVKHPFVSF